MQHQANRLFDKFLYGFCLIRMSQCAGKPLKPKKAAPAVGGLVLLLPCAGIIRIRFNGKIHSGVARISLSPVSPSTRKLIF